MNNIYIVCTTDSMILSFLLPYIEWFQKYGYRVRCFSSKTGDYFDKLVDHGVDITEIPFTRNPFTIQNIKAYRKLKKIMHVEGADLIFCHEPVGGVMGRICGKACRIPVIYMAHGFHFYKGASKINWMIFYPIEKIMSYLTDMLITINTEDYSFAQKHMKAKKVEYLPGVGIDISMYDAEQIDRQKKRVELGLKDDDIALISVGELNDNKNHIVVLEAMHNLGMKNLHYFIAGVGDTDQILLEKAKEYDITNQLHLLGYRRDCNELYAATDIFCFPSYREGLSVALMEAMASGLPVIVSKIRGNVDLIDEEGGILLAPNDVNGFAKAIETLSLDRNKRTQYGIHNQKKVKKYSIDAVLNQFRKQLYGLIET